MSCKSTEVLQYEMKYVTASVLLKGESSFILGIRLYCNCIICWSGFPIVYTYFLIFLRFLQRLVDSPPTPSSGYEDHVHNILADSLLCEHGGNVENLDNRHSAKVQNSVYRFLLG